MNNNIPRPRIQYWYKQKMGECVLANGWETIGELVDENQSAKDPANLRLFGPGDLDKRISTFDSFDFDVGAGQPGATHATVTGVSRVYMPLLPTTTGLTRATNDALFTALPRHKATDPPGYSPIAWLHDIAIPATTTYQPGSIKDVANVDLGAATPRDLAPAVTTNNIAVLGAASPRMATGAAVQTTTNTGINAFGKCDRIWCLSGVARGDGSVAATNRCSVSPRPKQQADQHISADPARPAAQRETGGMVRTFGEYWTDSGSGRPRGSRRRDLDRSA